METYFSSTEFERLSTAEKILHLQDAWDRIAEDPESVEVTLSQKEALDARLKALADDPGSGTSWEDIKDALRKR